MKRKMGFQGGIGRDLPQPMGPPGPNPRGGEQGDEQGRRQINH